MRDKETDAEDSTATYSKCHYKLHDVSLRGEFFDIYQIVQVSYYH